MTGLTAGLPFSASFLTGHERGGAYAGFLARDSRGREYRRIDFEPGLTMSGITDPIAEKMYTVNSQSGTVIETPYPPEQQIWQSEKRTWPEAERRVIEGIECFRREFGPHPPGKERSGPSGTAWLSPRIGLVSEEFFTEEGDRVSWRLYDINLDEPDPRLFEAPTAAPGP